MGNYFWSHSNSADNQENSYNSSHYYYYPPKNGGRYFGSTFIMGNDKFQMSQPESYLFGDNYDLNYLGGKPSPFPYMAPFPDEPMQMLKSLINIRKETVKLISPESLASMNASNEDNRIVNEKDQQTKTTNDYTIEFIFDSDVDCSITIYFLCKEDISPQGIKYIPKDISYRSETFHYKAGIGQQFSQSSPMFNPENYNICDLLYNFLDDKGEFNSAALYPVVVNCVAEEGEDPRQSHSLIATIEKVYDHVFIMKPIKQKIFVDGLTYLLQEIYGIENGKVDSSPEKLGSLSEYDNEKSFECVICMTNQRDTLILPCRHLCLCLPCADSLRFQANNCPICRVPFRALLQINACQRVSSTTTASNLLQTNNDINNVAPSPATAEDRPPSPIIISNGLTDFVFHLTPAKKINLPPEFEQISLAEGLNGIHPRSDDKNDDENDDDKTDQGDETDDQDIEEQKNKNKLDRKSSTVSSASIRHHFKHNHPNDNNTNNINKTNIKSEDFCSSGSSSSSSSSLTNNGQEKEALLISVVSTSTATNATTDKQKSLKD